jgi:hypothetical protein
MVGTDFRRHDGSHWRRDALAAIILAVVVLLVLLASSARALALL